MYIDFEQQEVLAALKTREGLTLGHINIPYPLKILEDGKALASKELIEAYQKKKDMHLERVLGQKNVDQYELWAQGVLEDPLFKRLEKIYIRKMGYVPSGTLIQIVNKLRPEFNNGVVPVEIAGRIKLNRELAGVWDVSGRASRRKTNG
jgi:hypothetical protein